MLQDVRLLYDLGDSINDTGKGPMTDLKNMSIRMPPIGDISVVDVFTDSVLKDLEKIRPHPVANCTTQELEAIKSLEQNSNIIIIKASDKGGNTVILDRDQYTTMCNSLLKNIQCYETLTSDPTEVYKTELRGILKDAKTDNLISSGEFDFLCLLLPKVATFYSLPKLHKGLSPLKGRPIVSGIDNLTQNSGMYIDKILRLFVQSIPSYVRDTTDLLQRLEGITIEEDWWLVSALYTSIPHSLGLEAVTHFLNTRGQPCP